MLFLLLTGLLWVGAAFPGHIVASVAAAGDPPLPHTVYPHWAALQGQHGSFQYTNPFVLDIPKEWNAAVTSMGASFWHYLRARMGAAVIIHFVRNGEFTRYTIYGNAYGCLWALTCIYNALGPSVAPLVFGHYGGVAPSLPALLNGRPCPIHSLEAHM